jgi:imidazoleglycerol phosphate synthase cyclase subunit
MALEPRIIPTLLLQGEQFVKTRKFNDPVYVGDPINVLSIFNELDVDEIALLDITGARSRKLASVDYLRKLTTECFVPLSYGGGITTPEQAFELIRVGFEKIIFNTALIESPNVIKEVISKLGSQAVVGALDVQFENGKFQVLTRGGQNKNLITIENWCELVMKLGIGEILLTNVGREGTLEGYDLELIQRVVDQVSIPVIANGGANSRLNLAEAIEKTGASAAAAGSLFVMQRGRESILINYPSRSELATLLPSHYSQIPIKETDPQKIDDNSQSLQHHSLVKRCIRCLITEDIPNAQLSDAEICYYCHVHDSLDREHELGKRSDEAFMEFVAELKKQGKGKKYDCIMGVSGGTDSSYLAHMLVSHGVRPLAVHFDNTWNSPIATSNIYAVLEKLNVELETYVVDNNEYDDIYRAFMLSGVRDIEAPTDIGFMGVLYRAAEKHGIKHIVEGHSFRTEGVSPIGWSYMDGGYIEDVHRRYGSIPLKTYPNMRFAQFIKWAAFSGIQRTRPLYWINYNKEFAKDFLQKEYGWQWYGGHHLENRFTAFYHSYFLPNRFGTDYRQIEFSALVRSGQLDREEAIRMLYEPRQVNPELIELVKKRLHFDDAEFIKVMQLPKRTYRDFKTYKTRFERLKPFFWVLLKLNRVPKSFYVKFCSRQNIT